MQKKLNKALSDHEKGLPLGDDRLTVSQFLDQWLEESVKPTVRQSTYVSYSAIPRLHLKPATIGKTAIAKLTPQQVQQMLNQKHDSGLSAARVQRIHAVLRRSLNIAQRWGLVSRNVATLVDTPRVTKEEVKTFTVEETAKLLKAVRGNRLETLYTVAVALGLRRGEILGLRWEDIDLDAGMLQVKRALQRVKGQGLVEVEPKSLRSRRRIKLPAYALESLKAHRLRQKQEARWGGTKWIDSGYVFTNKTGGPLDGDNLFRAYRKLLEDGKLPHLKFHSLRHLCATLLLTQGVPARTAMEILGHSQIGLTMNTYSHVMPQLLDDAAQRMDAVLRSGQ